MCDSVYGSKPLINEKGTDAAFRERETTNAKRLVFDAAKTQMLVFALRLARGDSPKRRAF